METPIFEQHRHHVRAKASCLVRPQPQELRKETIAGCTKHLQLVLQFFLVTEHDIWYKQPHSPSQLVYMAQSHRTDTKSFHLKFCAYEYLSCDAFYRVLEGNLNNWGDYYEVYSDVLIRSMIFQIHKFVDVELNKGGTNCQNLEMIVDLTLKMEYILDRRLEQPSSHLNGGMVPASRTSIMQLPERMEIDEDQCLNDECVICFEKLEGKIVCMPCSHMFHGDCIKNWLDKSHYCPVCRYNMPTSELES